MTMEGTQGLMAAGLLGAAMAQPIDDCLKTLEDLMVSGPLSAPVMSSSWQPADLLGRYQGGETKARLCCPSSTLAELPYSSHALKDRC